MPLEIKSKAFGALALCDERFDVGLAQMRYFGHFEEDLMRILLEDSLVLGAVSGFDQIVHERQVFDEVLSE